MLTLRQNQRTLKGHPKAHLLRIALTAGLTTVFAIWGAWLGAQVLSPSAKLPRSRYRSGDETLRAFSPIAAATRHSIVKLAVDGETVALGTVMDTNGLILTKASELKPGKLTCWLAVDRETEAKLLAVDEAEDLALVKTSSQDLTPIRWASSEVVEGQWAITPGIGPAPSAVGIISALPRRIRPQRAFIGVQFDFNSLAPKVGEVLPGLGAEKAGLKPGDLIVAVNRTAVSNRLQVIEALAEFRAGQIVSLRIQRAAEFFEVEVQMLVPAAEAMESGNSRRRNRRGLNGEVSRRAAGFEKALEHDTVLPPWLCGGPLVNLEGKAIGLNIARATRVSTLALPPKLVQRVYEELKARH